VTSKTAVVKTMAAKPVVKAGKKTEKTEKTEVGDGGERRRVAVPSKREVDRGEGKVAGKGGVREAEVEEAEEVVPVEVVPEEVPMIDITHPDFRTAPGIEAPVEPEVPEVPDGPREERGPMEEPELRLPGGGAVRLMAGPSALLDR
jgi:hypothetical protein